MVDIIIIIWRLFLEMRLSGFEPVWTFGLSYRIASNLTEISNYPDTIFFTSNYTVQSMKFEILF